MRIVCTISGGFAGLVKECRIETASLEPPERRRVESLVEESGLVESFERFSESARDEKQFDVTINRDQLVVHVIFDESSVPKPAKPLMAYLASRASPARPH